MLNNSKNNNGASGNHRIATEALTCTQSCRAEVYVYNTWTVSNLVLSRHIYLFGFYSAFIIVYKQLKAANILFLLPVFPTTTLWGLGWERMTGPKWSSRFFMPTAVLELMASWFLDQHFNHTITTSMNVFLSFIMN